MTVLAKKSYKTFQAAAREWIAEKLVRDSIEDLECDFAGSELDGFEDGDPERQRHERLTSRIHWLPR